MPAVEGYARGRAGVQNVHPALCAGSKARCCHALLDPCSVQAVKRLLKIEKDNDALLVGVLQVADLLKVGEHVVPHPAFGQEACLSRVHHLVEDGSKSAGNRPRRQLVVRVQQRDGPVAGWRLSVCPFPFEEEGDAPLEQRRRQRWAGLAGEGVLEHCCELLANGGPEALVELVRYAIQAWCLAARHAPEGILQLCDRYAAVTIGPFSCCCRLRGKGHVQRLQQLCLGCR